ncbi:MAG: flavodoxin [Oscillospiraceae bacterium]|nr:flavodoxin family protein [Clostridiales bacterium]MDD4096017.1 flavodoxin [Oscillospiraceae bacterium]
MKVGIIVYSNTGNTMSVAEKLEKALAAKGHSVEIKRVEAENEQSKPGSPVTLKTAPDIAPYGTVIFASPVHAFSLAPAMKLYLSQIASLNGKKTHCFVTQEFKKAWMGGNHAIRQISSACKTKGGSMISTGIVNWSGERREQQIEEIVAALSAI